MPSKQFVTSVYQFIRLSSASIIVCLLLNACASTPTTGTSISTKPIKQRLIPYDTLSRMQDPQKTIAAVANAEGAAQRTQYTLAENYLLLVTLNDNNIDIHQQALSTAVLLAPHTHQMDILSAWFKHNTTTNTHTELSDHFYFNAAIRNNDYQTAVSLGLPLSNNDNGSTRFLQQLWQSLQALSLYDANTALARQSAGSRAMGWASFAAAYLGNGNSLQRQNQQIIDWQSRWPNHAANNIAAKDIRALQQQASNMAQTAVVAIPLSGRLSRAGKAIQDAIIAAHLNRPQFNTLVFINSANYPATDDLLNAIKPYAPDVIIGPIDKSRARDLATSPNRVTPLITLNAFNTETTDHINAPSYQLSLNIEDEAQFLAEASPEAFTHALLISTANPLGTRAAEAFKQSWMSRQEAQLVTAPLTNSADFSKDIERYFLVSDSLARQTVLENIFIEKMESNPRRRKDIDVIFLSATANDARAINPLLAYHYAGDLPVLSPSIVFDGRYDSVSNRDLTGIVFSDTPWAISPAYLKTAMHYHTENGGAPSKNLHALGIDAYYFAARIKLWKTGENQSFNGLSGQHLIEPDGKTTRIPALARITKQGIIPQMKITP